MTSEIDDSWRREIEKYYRQEYSPLLRLATSVTRIHEDAEDAVQNVFLKLLQSGRPKLFDGNPVGYIHRSAFNEAVDIVRARKARRLAADALESFETPAPEIDAERQQDIDHVRAALAGMNPAAVEILKLRYWEGNTPEEIAKIQERGFETVRMALSRARAELKRRVSRQRKREKDLMKRLHSRPEPTFMEIHLAFVPENKASASEFGTVV